jgi:hypothetical protein
VAQDRHNAQDADFVENEEEDGNECERNRPAQEIQSGDEGVEELSCVIDFIAGTPNAGNRE